MSAKTARAFAPAGISSFFEICDTLEDGKPITDPQRIGARGGGFVIEKGVTTEVSVASAGKEQDTSRNKWATHIRSRNDQHCGENASATG